MHDTYTARLVRTDGCRPTALARTGVASFDPLQVDKLLSKGGHFFMVTVPDNKPEGELHITAVASVRCCPLAARETDAACSAHDAEILDFLSKYGLRGKLAWSYICLHTLQVFRHDQHFLLIAVLTFVALVHLPLLFCLPAIRGP